MIFEFLFRGRGTKKYIRLLVALSVVCLVIVFLIRQSGVRKQDKSKKEVTIIKDQDSNPTKWKYLFNDELLVFSTFLVDIDVENPFVRGYGLISTSSDVNTVSFYCMVRYENTGNVCPATGKTFSLEEIDSENRGWAYFPVDFKCPVISGEKPISISILKSTEDCKTDPKNLIWIDVVYPKAPPLVLGDKLHPKLTKMRNFGLCILPPDGFESVGQLLEVMELNRILGADLVLLYDQTWKKSEGIVLALQHYLKSGLLEIVDWHLPLDAHDRFNRHGQTVFLNDCLYRMKKKVKYIIYTDIDEFLIPLKHVDWGAMLEELETKNSKTASYHVDDDYFLIQKPDEKWQCKNVKLDEKPKLFFESKDVCPLVLSEITKLKNNFQYAQHSRCIVRPEKVNLVTVDKSIETLPGYQDIILNRDVVLSFHYIDTEEVKWWLPEGTKLISETDKHMLQYKEQLIYAIHENIKKWNS